MSWFKKKKQAPLFTEPLEFLAKIKKLDLSILEKGLRPQYGHRLVMTRAGSLSEYIRKQKYINSLFTATEIKNISIFTDKDAMNLSQFIGHSFNQVSSIRNSFIELFVLLEAFLLYYAKFQNSAHMTIVDQNKSRVFSTAYIQAKEFINSLSEITG